MAYPIYSPTAFGADCCGPPQHKQVTPATQKKAEAAVKSLRRSLAEWLKFRKRLDAYVQGKAQAPKIFRNPGVKPIPRSVVASTLREDRFATEQDLAEWLFNLLSEMGMDSNSLPQPNVATDPDAAVKLAEIVVNGKTPSEVNSPSAQGIVWFVLAIPVAGIVLLISQSIKSKADLAKEEARLRCIESGACTDTGFWIKMASIAVVGWIAWDKMGVREAVTKKK